MLAAMLAGALVGGQRASHSHPAGLRTHMLVALGACVVMLTGILLYQQTVTIYNTAPDPARMGAQVISGIGFLGAGTILKDGSTVRGLTTAASLWTVACFGIAAGMGYYLLAFCGAVCTFITLTVFIRIQKYVQNKARFDLELYIECEQTDTVLAALDQLAKEHSALLGGMSFTHTPRNTKIINLRMHFPHIIPPEIHLSLMQTLSAVPGVHSVSDPMDPY